MNLKQLTWSDFKKFEPCYDPQEKYGDFSGTILDILKDERIPPEDRLWAATREGILDDKTLRLFACACVREIWHLLTDERSRKAVEVAEAYAEGKATDEELAAAWDAAMAAARAAAWAAARAAAWYAAMAAAWTAAGAAAGDAAGDAAGERQVEILTQMIENQ